MSGKTSQLQIRVSPSEKATLKRLAADAGLSISAYVLSVSLPSRQLEFHERLVGLLTPADRDKALSDLGLFLSGLDVDEFRDAAVTADLDGMPLLLQNLAAAAVEQEAQRKSVPPPAWTARVPPLPRPHFSWELRSLRPHLMRVTPPSYKRRNVFLSVAGDRRQ